MTKCGSFLRYTFIIKMLRNFKHATFDQTNQLPRYNFIIADEAQDLFDKGLDLVIKALLKVNNPLWYPCFMPTF